MKAEIIQIDNQTLGIKSPYNKSFVADIKTVTGRQWDGLNKIWTVPASEETKAREITRKYFQIEGEEEAPQEFEIVKAEVWGGNTSKRSYPAGVEIDGIDLINLTWGNVYSRPNSVFEVLDYSGGFVRGDARHAFDVKYVVTVKCRKGATWEAFSSSHHDGGYKILSRKVA